MNGVTPSEHQLGFASSDLMIEMLGGTCAPLLLKWQCGETRQLWLQPDDSGTTIAALKSGPTYR